MFAKQGVPPDSGSTPTSSPLSGGPPSSPCPPTPLRKTIPALNMRMKTFKKSSAKIHDSLSRCRSGKPLHRYSGCQRGSNLELLRKVRTLQVEFIYFCSLSFFFQNRKICPLKDRERKSNRLYYHPKCYQVDFSLHVIGRF